MQGVYENIWTSSLTGRKEVISIHQTHLVQVLQLPGWSGNWYDLWPRSSMTTPGPYSIHPGWTESWTGLKSQKGSIGRCFVISVYKGVKTFQIWDDFGASKLENKGWRNSWHVKMACKNNFHLEFNLSMHTEKWTYAMHCYQWGSISLYSKKQLLITSGNLWPYK
jgi:hypothetical protein